MTSRYRWLISLCLLGVSICLSDVWAQKTGTHIQDDEALIETLNIKQMTFREVASLLSLGTGQRVVVSQQAGDTMVSVYLNHIRAEDALAAICNAYQCWYTRNDSTGVVTIVTIEEYLNGLSLQENERVQHVSLHYLDARQAGDMLRRLYKDRVVWERPDEEDSDAQDDLERALERMETLSESAQISDNSGDGRSRNGSSRNSNSRNGSYRDNSSSRNRNRESFRSSGSGSSASTLAETEQLHVEAEALLGQLEKARLTGETTIANRPGVVYISVYPNTNDLAIRSADTFTLDRILKTLQAMDRAKPQVLIEVKVLEIKLEDKDARGVDWLFQSSDVSGGRSTGLLPAFEGGAGAFGKILAPDGNLVPQGTLLDPNSAVLQVVSDEVLMRLQLLQDQNRLASLASPNLCVADGEVSRVFVGMETTVLTGLESETDVNTADGVISTYTSTDPETERRNVGTTLLITPRIHSQERVTIRLVQEDSQLGTIREIDYGTNSFKAQDVETRSVATTIVGSNGKISAVGGLIRESQETRESGIPILKDIPWLGAFFKSDVREEVRTELIVLMRPYILSVPGEEETLSREMLDRLSAHPSAHDNFPSLGVGTEQFEAMPGSEIRP